MRPGVTHEWERVLRALVWQAADAWEAGDLKAHREACRLIVDTHARWPLVQYAIELRYARTVQRARRAEIERLVALMRDTYPQRLEEAA